MFSLNFYVFKNNFLFVSLLSLFFLAGCDSDEESKDTSSKKTVINVGHVVSEKNSGHQGMLEFDKILQKKTDGKISLKIFSNAQLGSERELIEAVQLGNLDMAFVSSAPLAGFAKEFYALDMPFLFKNRASVYKVLDGEVGKEILDELELVNIKGLGYWENGFRQLSNNSKPITKLSDLSGLKIRTMENEIHLAAWKALGANPAPLAFGELFTALQQGTFDAQEQPLGLFRDMKFQEAQKFITKTNHIYSPYVVIMNKSLFDGFNSKDKEAIEKSFDEAKKYQRDLAKSDDKDAEVELSKTVEFSDLSNEEREKFVERMTPVYDLVKQKAGNKIVDEVLKEIQ